MAVVAEHLIIALKIVISMLIPDVPKQVKDDEFKRSQLEEGAHREMSDLKIKHGYETLEDAMDRLRKQASVEED